MKILAPVEEKFGKKMYSRTRRQRRLEIPFPAPRSDDKGSTVNSYLFVLLFPGARSMLGQLKPLPMVPYSLCKKWHIQPTCSLNHHVVSKNFSSCKV